MLAIHAQAINMPLIVSAVQAMPTDIISITGDEARYAIDGPIQHPCDEQSPCVYTANGGADTYDDANDALATLARGEADVCVIVRDNPNDVRADVIIYSREPVTIQILIGA